jgi:hypothetical protein
MASDKELAMQSKSMVVAGLGLGALLVAVGACSQASRSETLPKNGSTTQRDNAPSTDAQVMACTDVTGGQIGGFMSTDAPTMNGSFLPHGSKPPAPPPTTDIAPTCDKPLAMPPVAAGNDFHYHSYTFANDGDAAACVSVTFDLGFIKSGPKGDVLSGVETLAYLDRFDPTDIEKNYLAGYFGLQFGNGMPAPNDADFASAAAGIMASFSFKVPAHGQVRRRGQRQGEPSAGRPPGPNRALVPVRARRHEL